MPLRKDMTHEEIVQELMRSYKENGKIGDHAPESEEKALQIANAVAYSFKKRVGG